MAVGGPVQLERRRIDELIERELAQLNARTAGSASMYSRARTTASWLRHSGAGEVPT